MGCKISKTTSGSTISQTQMQNSNLDPIQPSLTTYEHDCRLDSDLQTFDSVLHQRTDRVIAGLERNLSIGSFVEVTRCLNEMNQETVTHILAYKKDLWKDNDMCDLVQDYFDSTLLTLDFCNSLQTCLKRARNSPLMIRIILNVFESEKICGNYERTLQELRKFSAAGAEPFDDEFISLLQSLPMKQKSLLQKLERKRRILDAKLKSVKAWRRVSNVIFATVFVGVIVFSVVAAAILSPPVVVATSAAVAAATAPIGTMAGKWLNSFWKKYQNEFKVQREIVTGMRTGTRLVIRDLEGIRIHVDRLKIKIEALLQKADFAIREEDEAVMVVVEEMKKMIDEFMQAIDDLSKIADQTSTDIAMARSVISSKIILHPSDI